MKKHEAEPWAILVVVSPLVSGFAQKLSSWLVQATATSRRVRLSLTVQKKPQAILETPARNASATSTRLSRHVVVPISPRHGRGGPVPGVRARTLAVDLPQRLHAAARRAQGRKPARHAGAAAARCIETIGIETIVDRRRDRKQTQAGQRYTRHTKGREDIRERDEVGTVLQEDGGNGCYY